jgi:hypothetical protein
VSAGKAPGREPAAPPRRGGSSGGRWSFWRGLLVIAGAFVIASAIAGALGAVNLGTALSFGQIAVALTVVYLMLRR